MNVIKRNGSEVIFDIEKIKVSLTKANNSIEDQHRITDQDIMNICNKVWTKSKRLNRAVAVEEIQDFVEDALISLNKYAIAKHYIKYRHQRELDRKKNTTDARILSIVDGNNEEAKQENANKNPILNSTQRDYMAGEVSKDITNRYLLPEDIQRAHAEGIIHFHDADYFAQHMHNCCLWNLEDMLQNGTVINNTLIEKPHSFATACNICTQIMAQIASNQYGGQTITLSHLAPFVQVSREKIYKEVKTELADLEGYKAGDDLINKITESRVREEVKRGVQTIQYQVNTLLTSNGQTPFITVSMYLGEVDDPVTKRDLAIIIEEVLNQRIQGVKNEKGYYITPAFPKLVYVLEEDNIHQTSPYFYLTELAAKCTAKRMVPDYVSEKVMKANKIDKNGEGHCYPPMGCRSFLTPYVDPITNKFVAFSRFNQGVVTLNLIDVACSAKKNMDKFWKLLDERLELCHRALRIRHERLRGTSSDVAPILWQHGALARLQKGEKIDKLLYGGYSTISLGYVGLWETVYHMTGSKLTETEGKEFGLSIMKKMNEYTNKWKEAENIDYSLYGTPIESTTYKFAKCLQRRFGIIPGVTDKSYVTNSYHVHVTENIDAFSKLELESEFQLLSPGGAISYVEVPNMEHNIPAVLSVINFIYDNIMYAELNTKSDFCQECNYSGEINIITDANGKLIWECPNCHNRNRDKMNIARRVCGYISTNDFNAGRTHEIKERVLHL